MFVDTDAFLPWEMWGFRALGDGWLDYHNLVGLQSSLMLTLCTFCLFDAEWKTGNIMHRLPCKYALNLILCKHDLTKGRNLDQNFQHYTEKSRACVCMPCRSHSRTLNPEAFVEERAETIERSEIVEVRTYPPCARVCFIKSFPGGPWCVTNKQFYIRNVIKPHTYIGVFIAQWINAFKFYC